MGSSVRIKVHRDAVRSVLNGGGVSGMLLENAERIAATANSRVPRTRWSKNPNAFEANVDSTGVSAVANVVTANPTGMNFQAKHHILESSV